MTQPQPALTSTPAPLYPPAPTPPPEPLSQLAFLATFVRNPIATLPEAVYRQPIFTRTARGRQIAWVTGPDLIREVLLERAGQFQKSALERKVLGPLLGNGILIAEGPEWRWQRQVVAPLFRPQELSAYVPAMVAAGEDQVRTWRAASNPIRSIDTDMTAVTFRIITDTILPADEATLRIITGASDDYLGPISWPIAYAMFGLPDWMPHPGRGRMNRAQSQMRAAVTALVRARKASGERRVDLLDKLLAARDSEGNGMPDALLVDNLVTFMAAGHATTAMALTWTLYLLARAPEWAERIRTEVLAAAGNGPLAAEHMEKLPVTTRVLKEALRLYPAAPVLTRFTTDAVELGGEKLGSGTLVVVPIWAVHRHHDLWTDPGRFDPDRFLPEAEAARPRYHYLPFGAGPRICVGMSFSMLEAVLLAATFARAARFAVLPGEPPEPLSRVTLRPRGGLRLIVTPR